MYYPRLMQNKNQNIVVLFDSEKCGTVLMSTNDEYEVGEYLEIWNMNNFDPYEKTLELNNVSLKTISKNRT